MQTNLNLWVIINCCFLDQPSVSNSDLHEHTYIYSGTWLRGRLSSHRQLHSSIYSQFHCGSMPDPRGCISWRQKVHLTDMSPHQILRSVTKINSLLIEYHWEIWFDNIYTAQLATYFIVLPALTTGTIGDTNWAALWQNQQSECAPSKDSEQPGHPPSLIRVFAVRMKKAWVLSYPLSAQRRLWSDWADAQADLNLCWAHTHFVGFVTRRLKCSSPTSCHQIWMSDDRLIHMSILMDLVEHRISFLGFHQCAIVVNLGKY